MTHPDFDKKAEDTKFDVKEEAQKQKMGNASTPHNPNKAPRTNEPNAGGANREKGHRG
ncbi:hypothetical protein [Ketogulonicigenium vulgare]|uniref:Uncharacterized protein n=1 Tax=Ketogulonicigenium vulgare (strain WSH-001) TaxID=759362 RepID=F9Y4Q8_KETVW|nr:hypothetical protein [Ketogulonicigenium vulgare]ADO42415.1 hypothetical protein EIO_1273 [Ketogulonicigenium vulgare Y25]AEM40615.1 hypothetical protein KVU_0776 [Ketogulonicigenium vulgare WSH-001]ALJ80788.1 hypothetical protein KVH_06115 [Ketogulonicigenium vulgare]ANW34990.1 hypothetical protein KvSKV_06085 [Ketogulonicigenium vulgare]AOZ54327.1 hypothetical protein KVC_1310 [Ketogulonicigenium vulgare]